MAMPPTSGLPHACCSHPCWSASQSQSPPATTQGRVPGGSPAPRSAPQRRERGLPRVDSPALLAGAGGHQAERDASAAQVGSVVAGPGLQGVRVQPAAVVELHEEQHALRAQARHQALDQGVQGAGPVRAVLTVAAGGVIVHVIHRVCILWELTCAVAGGGGPNGGGASSA